MSMTEQNSGMTLQEALDQAVALHNSGNLGEAETIYRQVLAADPENADAYHLLGMVAYQAGSFQEALILMDRSIELRPGEATFVSHREAVVQAAAAKDGQDHDPIFGELTIEQAFNVALSHFSSGRPEEAEQSLIKILAAAPKHADCLHLLGIIRMSRNDVAGAEALFRQAIALQPGNPNFFSNYGMLLAQAGKRDAAISCLTRACELQPDSLEARQALESLTSQPLSDN